MQESDRAEFDGILAEIFAAIDKPLWDAPKSAFWKGLKDMSIVEFSRCRDLLIREFRGREEAPRKFTIGDIWGAKKRLRAQAAPVVTQQDDGWRGDKWDLEANRKLLGYITRVIPTNTKRYGQHTPPSREFIRNVNVLVAFKNRWAELMRTADPGDGVPMDEQNQSWNECIRMGEAEIAKVAAA